MAYSTHQDGRYISLAYESGTVVAHRFVLRGTADTQFKPISGASDYPVGVIHDTTTTAGQLMAIQVDGIARVEVGTGGVTKDKMVKLVDNLGKVCDATPTYGTEYIVGKALESGSAGDFVDIEIIYILP